MASSRQRRAGAGHTIPALLKALYRNFVLFGVLTLTRIFLFAGRMGSLSFRPCRENGRAALVTVFGGRKTLNVGFLS